MDPAAPVEAPDGVRLGPPLHRLGPFLGQVVLCESLQGAHELAVDDPGRERIEVTGDGRDSHLVEQRETLPNIAAEDEEPRFCHAADRARRRVASRTDLDRTRGPLSSVVQVARQHSLVGSDHRKPRVRRRLARTFRVAARLARASRAPAPSGPYREQVHRDANGRACRRDRVAGLQARRVCAFPRLDGHVEMAGGVGDLAENR